MSERETDIQTDRQTARQTERDKEKIFECLIIDISHCKNNNHRFHVKLNAYPNFIKYTQYIKLIRHLFQEQDTMLDSILSRCLESVMLTHERDVILDQQADLPPTLR